MSELYIALSGANAAWRQLSTIGHNLANGGTHGFREARVSFQLAGPDVPLGKQFAVDGETAYSNEDGAVEVDGVATHVALRGDGFFALEDGTFTRNGAFRIATDGRLVNEQGVSVLGENGPLQVQPNESLTVEANGTVRGSTSGDLGKFNIVTLQDPQPMGGSRWSGTAGEPPDNTRVMQGALEGSNTDTMRGMIEMMEASRFFEAQQKAMQTSDDLSSRLNRIGGS